MVCGWVISFWVLPVDSKLVLKNVLWLPCGGDNDVRYMSLLVLFMTMPKLQKDFDSAHFLEISMRLEDPVSSVYQEERVTSHRANFSIHALQNVLREENRSQALSTVHVRLS